MNAALRRAVTAPDEVYLHLKQMILDGRLKGGDRVNVVAVARTLGVSRMPVREALRLLDSDGLVTVVPNRGAVVTKLTPDEVRELFEIRAALEGLAMRHAVPRLGEEVLEELDLLRRRMERAREDPKAWLDRHDALHERLCALSGMDRLCAEIRRVREAVAPYLLMYIDIYAGPEMLGQEHRTLLQELGRSTPDQAERLMEDHIMSAAAGVIRFLRGEAQARGGQRVRARGAPVRGRTPITKGRKTG